MAADEKLNVTVPNRVEDENLIRHALDSASIKNGAT